MSKIEVNAIEPQCGTNLTVGASGDTITFPSGTTVVNNGSQTGFGRTGTVDWDTTAKTASFTAVSGNGYFVNTTSGAITLTLPASPSAGDIVAVSDYAQTSGTNNITIGRNSSNINGSASDIIISINGKSITLVYVDGTQGWKITDNADQTTEGPAFVTATGGTITTCGNFKIHTFTGPGTFCVSCAGSSAGSDTVSYVVVAGAGGGGGSALGYYSGGGGGAGGFREGKASSDCYTASPLNAPAGLPVTVQGYPITVGGGGSAGGGSASSAPPVCRSPGGGGNNSVFSTITSAGGGEGGESGGDPGTTPNVGIAGGSGGGGGGFNGNPDGGLGAGNTPPVSPPQGNPGGAGSLPNAGHGGGGGGATTAGTGSTGASSLGNAGGAGAETHITGSPVTYAAGGIAGKSPAPTQACNGAANTGDGGMAGANNPGDADGGTGGSGIVIIRYKFQ